MRMNELIAGVRADVAVKLFGDDLDQLIASGQELEEIVGGVPGAADVKLEQVTGLPVLSIVPRREMLASYGVSMATVQDIVATATGGQGSEEHTSELQSLMRISYAVFCLKKKNKCKNQDTVLQTH